MKFLIRIGVLATMFTAVSAAEWRREPLDSDPAGEWRHLFEGEQKIYSFLTRSDSDAPDERVTLHRFFWRGKVVLELTETEGMDDLNLGNTICSVPEAGAPTESCDYNRDGVVDVVQIGVLTDENMLFFGRYKDGVFALVPMDLNFTELWAYLEATESEEACAEQPATAPEPRPEDSSEPQPESEGLSP